MMSLLVLLLEKQFCRVLSSIMITHGYTHDPILVLKVWLRPLPPVSLGMTLAYIKYDPPHFLEWQCPKHPDVKTIHKDEYIEDMLPI